MDAPDFASRRVSVAVDVGGVIVGGGRPIVVQSMTNTDTADADATAIQVAQLAHAGSELVRITVNNEAAAAAVPEIVRKVRGLGVDVPIIGDFHYNGHKLLVDFPEAARALAKYRINPGNVGSGPPPRRPLRGHRPGRRRERQAGPDRRQLGLARSGRPGRADGRQRAPAGAEGCARRHDRSHGRERHSDRPNWRRRPAWPTTRSSSRPRFRACATWSTSTAGWLLAATTRSIWASPRPAWA